MSGSDLAYHLRVNKAIERNLFVELLVRVGRVRNISDYEYIGFGGPFLEDYKALHAGLRMSKMLSIESDPNTYLRQQFNRPAAFVDLRDKHSSEFFRTHNFSDAGTVVWLDYTGQAELKSQLDEFRQVVSQLDTFDVAKITLQASPDKLGSGDKKPHELPAYRVGVLNEKLAEYVPPTLTGKDMTGKTFPLTLQACVRNALSTLSARAGARYFQILSSFVYKDGQTMLTITGMVLEAHNDQRLEQFLNLSRLRDWPFGNLDWSAPQSISVPSLSAKERMRLDERLPISAGPDANPGRLLEQHLGYLPGCVAADLANYARFYRAYPHFSRVVL